MKMDKVAGSGNDEFYTPRYAIRPILKYLAKNSIVWCPFDTEDSLFKELLEEDGHTVIISHIEDGGNFFDITLPKVDYIISNPPYSIKKEVFERLFELKVPFAMLVGVVGLFESQARFEMFRDNDFDIIFNNDTFTKKVEIQCKKNESGKYSSDEVRESLLNELNL